MAKRNKQLTFTINLDTMLEDIEVDDVDTAVKEYAEYMTGEEIAFTQDGNSFTFKGTESQLVEVLYKDQLHWGAGFSFSEEDAVDEIREQNA
jgi:hypothetical protein